MNDIKYDDCVCQTIIDACCTCVSMHCDKCNPYSKNTQYKAGSFCSACGRPVGEKGKSPLKTIERLKGELRGKVEYIDELCVTIDRQQAEIEKLKKECKYTTLEKCWYSYYTGKQGKRKHLEMKLVCTECRYVWDTQGYAFSYCPNCGRQVVDDEKD